MPVLLISPEGHAAEKAGELFGADSRIGATDIEDGVAKTKAAIEQLADFPHSDIDTVTIHTHRDLFMIVEYRKLFVRGREVALSKGNFDMLELMMSQPGRVFSFEQLYAYAKGDDATPYNSLSNSVQCHIKRIRHAIKPHSDADHYFDAVRGTGYRLAL